VCGAHHMMKNAMPAQCTRECVKHGALILHSPSEARSTR
jgi:hypothetical protein